MSDSDFKPTHRHYKGGLYRVIETGVIHSETDELMVLYQTADGRLFVRPQQMFFEKLEDGRARFEELIEED